MHATVAYIVHLTGGGGKSAGATGDFTNIGEVDLNSGQLVLHYSGKLCFGTNRSTGRWPGGTTDHGSSDSGALV
jgi:hypothetical protein